MVEILSGFQVLRASISKGSQIQRLHLAYAHILQQVISINAYQVVSLSLLLRIHTYLPLIHVLTCRYSYHVFLPRFKAQIMFLIEKIIACLQSNLPSSDLKLSHCPKKTKLNNCNKQTYIHYSASLLLIVFDKFKTLTQISLCGKYKKFETIRFTFTIYFIIYESGNQNRTAYNRQSRHCMPFNQNLDLNLPCLRRWAFLIFKNTFNSTESKLYRIEVTHLTDVITPYIKTLFKFK